MTYRTRNIAIAVGLALVAMMLTLLYVTSYRHSVQSEQAMVHVYVADHDIPSGTPGSQLTGDLTLIGVPRHAVVPDAITNPDQLAGLVSTQPIYTGDQISTARFESTRTEGIADKLKGTMRAVEVAGNPQQLLAGTLQAGDRVDLVADFHPLSNDSAPVATIVLRDLEVLSAPGSSSVSVQAPGGQSVSAIVAVSDTQVQRLFYVLENANWTFELRPAVGASDSPDHPETEATILQEGSH